MQLKKSSDLSLQVLMFIAHLGPGQRTTAAAVAEALGASKAHVAKVVSTLASLQYLDSAKGRGGGIALMPDALDRSLGALIRQLEQGEVVDCQACALSGACGLRGHLARAQEAFFASLDGVKIAEVV
ncbi:RrF2 family transcriptional regulator [Corynebacterium pseudopelargi]|nr:Rrf2 family transcriptional regulator [Corynebacterium pseudopelargi]